MQVAAAVSERVLNMKNKSTHDDWGAATRITPEEVQPNDVLCYRSAHTHQHQGNKRFRTLVKMNREKYQAAKRVEKFAFIQAVISGVHESHGRFLKPEEDFMEDGEKRRPIAYLVMRDDQIRCKVAHALRCSKPAQPRKRRARNTKTGLLPENAGCDDSDYPIMMVAGQGCGEEVSLSSDESSTDDHRQQERPYEFFLELQRIFLAAMDVSPIAEPMDTATEHGERSDPLMSLQSLAQEDDEMMQLLQEFQRQEDFDDHVCETSPVCGPTQSPDTRTKTLGTNYAPVLSSISHLRDDHEDHGNLRRVHDIRLFSECSAFA